MKRILINHVLFALVVSLANGLLAATTATTRPDDIVDLTSPTGAAVTSENLLNNMSPQKAFNDATSLTDTSNRFITNNKKTATLAYTFDTPTAVNAIGIQNFNNGDCTSRSPKAWKFYGSNDFDGTREGLATATWTELDARSGETEWAKPEYRYYQFDNVVKYKSYKIDFTDTNDNSYLQIQKLEYFYYSQTGVEIAGEPADYGDISYDNLRPEIGSTVTLSAFDGSWVDAAGTTSATCRGYELRAKNTETGAWETIDIGTGTTCSFTMTETSYKLIWKFDRSFKVTVAAAEHGSVGGLADWYPEGSPVSPTLTPDEGYGFFKWETTSQSVCPAEAAFYVTEPLTMTPVFAPVVTLSEGENAINTALALATDEPLILRLKPGTYKESSGTANAIVVDKPVRIEGLGATPAEVTISRDAAKSASARVFKLDHADAVIKNATISGGYGKGNNEPVQGGNVYITAKGGTIIDAVISGGSLNTYNSCGGNVRMLGGHLLRCVVQNGYTATGYGSAGGGGIMADGASLIENCLIKGNTIGSREGNAAGVALSGSARLVNCTLVKNGSTSAYVGAVNASGSARVVNCAIFDNIAKDIGTGSNQTWGGSAAAFENCYADVLINDTCFQTATPAFSDADRGDYSLSVSSPLRDQGAHYQGTGATSAKDLVGAARVNGAAVDVGAYEFEASGLIVDFTADVTEGLTPCVVTFTATVEGASGEASYAWDFDGDGVTDETTATPTITKTYAGAGNWSVGLTVTADGNTAEASHDAMVKTCQKTLYVSTDSEPAYPFATWATAATSIAEAVEAAVDGCEILVADGDYAVTQEIVVAKALRICGASGSPTAVTVHNAERSGVRAFSLDNAAAFVANMELQGNGSGNGKTILITNAGGTVSNCVVHTGTSSVGWGQAGAAIHGTKAFVTHCTITGNGNAHLGDGWNRGGVVHFESASRIENTLIANCSVTYQLGNSNGGGFTMTLKGGSSAANCTIVNCMNSTEQSGGLYLEGTSRATNCVVYDVRNPTGAGAETWYAGVLANFDHCGATDLTAAAFADYANGDYTPVQGGALYDAGTTEGLTLSATDLAGHPRVQHKGLIDIGCYECVPKSGLIVVLR